MTPSEPPKITPRCAHCVFDVLGRPHKRDSLRGARLPPRVDEADWRALAGLSRQDVERTPGVGVGVLREMDEWLEYYGLSFEC